MKMDWRTPDGMALILAGALVVGTLIWMVFNESRIAELGDQVGELSGGEIPPSAEFADPVPPVSSVWTDPTVGATEDAWVFDVFTPPVIYYDRETGRFSVSAPEVLAPSEENARGEPFGLSLEGVVREPYRLQLVGYAGTETDPIGIFENVTTTDGVVARKGHVFADLDLELRSLVVQRQDLILPDSMPLREIVAVAEIWDRRAGGLQRLTSTSSAWATRPKAEMILVDSGERRTVQAGNQIETKAGVFLITGVFFSPDSVTVTKRLPNGTQESLRLTP